MPQPQTVMTGEEMARTLTRIAHQILEMSVGLPELALVGVHTRGAPLARRLAERIAAAGQARPAVGMLDINLYRDDLSRARQVPVLRRTDIPFPIDERTIVLVDDVLYTGRTVRAALDALADLGRPRLVRLAAFIDRGGRELPIQADVVGRAVSARSDQSIEVHLSEVDGGRDEVVLITREPPARITTPKPAPGRRPPAAKRPRPTAARKKRSGPPKGSRR